MVLGDEELEPGVGEPLDVEPDQRGPVPVEGPVALGGVAGGDGGALRLGVEAVQVLEGELRAGAVVDELEGLGESVRVEGGAQHLVPGREDLDGGPPGLLGEGRFDQVGGHVVVNASAGRGQVAVVEHAGLEPGHRVGVLQSRGQGGAIGGGQ
ncbi:hypothetical protein VR44_14930 [Streptomyces katrae]|uniref:Uncharacterized protein n=1 Tax=Streptomyces katrae TaxID=68223 RepID=A0A0F4JGF4_9ACTN|nr:hypothetical protein VR44_14930 [Streptomyces katrae]